MSAQQVRLSKQPFLRAKKCCADQTKHKFMQPSTPCHTMQDMAQHCYQRAVHQQADKRCVRQLSALVRHLSGRKDDKAAAVQHSVALAKQAVALDTGDGCSWCECSMPDFLLTCARQMLCWLDTGDG